MHAQMRVNAPSTVGVGQTFRIVYEVEGKASDFVKPTLKGLSLVGGPSVGTSSSVSIINGQYSQSSTTSFTLFVVADKEGSVNVGVARCKSEGKELRSDPLSIKVEKNSPRSQAQNNSRPNPFGRGARQQQQQQPSQPAATTIDKNTLFARASINKTNLYKGEEAIIVYKIYTQVPVTQFQIDRLPRIKGFWSEDLSENMTQVKQYTETYNGRQYQVAEIRRGALYPQEAGSLTIEPLKTDVVAIIQSRMERQRTGTILDFFIDDPFFNPVQQQAIQHSLSSNSLKVNVRELPEAPDGFAGGVGRFEARASADITQLRANEALTYSVTVSGHGNLSLLEPPAIQFPQGLEVYEPRVVDNINKGDNGLSGSRTFEWIIIPQTQGDYTIPAFDYVYFDPAQSQYVSASVSAVKLKVSKAAAGSAGKNDVKELNSDIHYICKASGLRSRNADNGASGLFWCLLLLIPVAAVVVVLLVRRRQRIMGDETSMRLQRASKLARKRLRNAERCLRSGHDDQFYEEIYKALWGCVADKFNISLSLLSADTVKRHLEERQVDEAVKQQLLKTLQDVDYARFAPGDSSAAKQSIYDEAMDTIVKIGSLKVEKKKRPAAPGAALAALLLLSISAFAQMPEVSSRDQAEALFQQGVAAYDSADYPAAVEAFNSLIDQGWKSWQVYYNLGNAYYRQEELAQAILSYERAHRLNPTRKEIKDNLALARSKTVDRIEVVPRFFLVEWTRSVASLLSPRGWRTVLLIGWLLFCAVAALFLVSTDYRNRKWCFISGFVLLVLMIFFTVNATISARDVSNKKGAVITASMVVVKSAPEAGSVDKFVLHEGTKVLVTDQQDQWWQIEIDDGKSGWIAEGAERI